MTADSDEGLRDQCRGIVIRGRLVDLWSTKNEARRWMVLHEYEISSAIYVGFYKASIAMHI